MTANPRLTSLLIDSNNTLEDSATTIGDRTDLYRFMAESISKRVAHCSPGLISEVGMEYTEQFGAYLWEYHPVFWRSVLRRIVDVARTSDCVDCIYEEFLRFYRERVVLYDDALGFLQSQSEKRKLALVANANGRRLNHLIDKFNLDRYLSSVSLSGESPFRKPEPFQFVLALGELATSPEQTLMVGDRYDTDIVGACNLGIAAVHILRPGIGVPTAGTPESCPDAEVTDLRQLDWLLSNAPISTWEGPQTADSDAKQNAVPVAIVLCGGRGRRMGELTLQRQKCTLAVGDAPMLEHVVKCLAGVGCSRILAAVQYRAEDIRNLLGDGRRYGVDVEYVTGDFATSLEVVLHCLPDLPRAFYCVHGDVLVPPRVLQQLWLRHCNVGRAAVVLVQTDEPIGHSRMMVSPDQWVTEVDSSGVAGSSKGLLSLGLALYTRDLFEGMPRASAKGRFADWAVGRGLERGLRTSAVIHHGRWIHIATPDDYAASRDVSAAQLVGW